MDPGRNYRVDLWIQAGLQSGSMDSGKDYDRDGSIDHISRAIGMDYRMDLWIYVSRNGLQDESTYLCIQEWIADGSMDLCIQIWTP